MMLRHLCPPFTPREESSPYGLGSDWHCELSARRRANHDAKTPLDRAYVPEEHYREQPRGQW